MTSFNRFETIEFVAKATKLARERKVGGQYEADVLQGPQIDEVSQMRILAYIESAKLEGAKLETGGNRWGTEGFFVEPTVFSNVTDNMKIARDEVCCCISISIGELTPEKLPTFCHRFSVRSNRFSNSIRWKKWSNGPMTHHSVWLPVSSPRISMLHSRLLGPLRPVPFGSTATMQSFHKLRSVDTNNPDMDANCKFATLLHLKSFIKSFLFSFQGRGWTRTIFGNEDHFHQIADIALSHFRVSRWLCHSIQLFKAQNLNWCNFAFNWFFAIYCCYWWWKNKLNFARKKLSNHFAHATVHLRFMTCSADGIASGEFPVERERDLELENRAF